MEIADARDGWRERGDGAAQGTPRRRNGGQPRPGAANAVAHDRRRQERAALARLLNAAAIYAYADSSRGSFCNRRYRAAPASSFLTFDRRSAHLTLRKCASSLSG